MVKYNDFGKETSDLLNNFKDTIEVKGNFIKLPNKQFNLTVCRDSNGQITEQVKNVFTYKPQKVGLVSTTTIDSKNLLAQKLEFKDLVDGLNFNVQGTIGASHKSNAVFGASFARSNFATSTSYDINSLGLATEASFAIENGVSFGTSVNYGIRQEEYRKVHYRCSLQAG